MEHIPFADTLGMGLRSTIAVLGATAVLVVPAGASGAYSVGTHAQIAWVRRAASNFVAAELTANGASACSILDAKLRTTRHHRTCTERWNVKLAELLHKPGVRARLLALDRAIPHAAVVVYGNTATIDLPAPLMSGANRFSWTENCWMLQS
jgi:hypothetical protein